MDKGAFKKLLFDNDITEKNDAFAYNVFNFWHENNGEETDKSDNCLTYKLKEYTFTRDSLKLQLPFIAEMNWSDQYGADIFLKSNTYDYVAADYKHSKRIFHPYKKNPWNITAHNCFSLKLQQVEAYCRDGLKYIVCDRDITLDDEENKKAAEFLKRYNWANESLDIEEKRTIIIIDVKRLCFLLGREEEIVHLTVPEHKRNETINGEDWDGRTILFSYHVWPSFEVTKTTQAKDRHTSG